jgi:hypothetical protein
MSCFSVLYYAWLTLYRTIHIIWSKLRNTTKWTSRILKPLQCVVCVWNWCSRIPTYPVLSLFELKCIMAESEALANPSQISCYPQGMFFQYFNILNICPGNPRRSRFGRSWRRCWREGNCNKLHFFSYLVSLRLNMVSLFCFREFKVPRALLVSMAKPERR